MLDQEPVGRSSCCSPFSVSSRHNDYTRTSRYVQVYRVCAGCVLGIVYNVGMTNLTLIDWTPVEIKRFRRLLRLSQAAFAEALGVSVNSVYNWESVGVALRASSLRLLDDYAREVGYRPEVP